MYRILKRTVLYFLFMRLKQCMNVPVINSLPAIKSAVLFLLPFR